MWPRGAIGSLTPLLRLFLKRRNRTRLTLRQTAVRAAVSVVSSILAISLSLARISWISLLGFVAKVFQLIKAGSTLPDVGEQVRELTVRGLLREFQQDFAPWTVDALRIWKVFMHHSVKCIKQFFFGVHSARRS